MVEGFVTYLVGRGYRLTTRSGKNSTVYSYIKAITDVCDWEGISLETLEDRIVEIVPRYDVGGPNEDLGSKSHRTVINALKRFKEFVQSR
ncbi:MAG: hypothetical protein IKB51_01385 [Clostridia bacterium]|nr:hypothetical protein [Clostridia bacterium]